MAVRAQAKDKAPTTPKEPSKVQKVIKDFDYEKALKDAQSKVLLEHARPLAFSLPCA